MHVHTRAYPVVCMCILCVLFLEMPLEAAVFVGNKIENDFCGLIFITPVVERDPLDLYPLVLPLDEVSKYFISEQNRNVLRSPSYLTPLL